MTNLARFNLAAKVYAVNLLNSGAVIYLSLLGILFSTSLLFVLRTVLSLNELHLVTFYQHLHFLLNFFYLCCIDLFELM